jgi:23S rRNA (guanosine2251-2'-O)-methyltransferase
LDCSHFHFEFSMPSSIHYFIECLNPECRFRFPVSGRKLTACPNCRQTRLAITQIEPSPVEGIQAILPSPFYGALLDNIRSIHNVGSIFRTADGLGLEHLYLCGLTATPEHPRLAKTALGSQHTTRWSHHLNAVDTVRSLIAEGFQVWALEGGSGSASIFNIKTLPSSDRIVLAVGNEITGVDPEILKLCQSIFFIPMQGMKGSLNVSVAFGIAAYYLRFSIPAEK